MCDEPLEGAVQRIARCGYDAIEVDADLEQFEPVATRRLLDEHGISAWGTVAAMFDPGRDLLHADPAARAATEDYLRKTVDFTAAIGAEVVVVVPSQIGKGEPMAEAEQEWAWCVEGLGNVGRYAQEHGVKIAIEPILRWETYFVNRAEQAVKLAEYVDLPSVGVCLDSANMYGEEVDPVAAIKATGKRLFDFHVADANRRPPGQGAIDWSPLLAALGEVGYDGPLGVELLPVNDRSPLGSGGGDPFKMSGEKYEEALRASAAYLRELA
jgi:sugar phosphate isomerase/epimerase